MIKSSPREYFLYAVSFIALSFVSFRLNNVAVTIGNSLIGFKPAGVLAKVSAGDSMPTDLTLLASGLVVFLVTQFLINKDIKLEPAKKDLTLRKSFFYLWLFLFGYLLFSTVNGLIIHLLGVEVDYKHVVVRAIAIIVTAAFFVYGTLCLRKKMVPSRVSISAAVILVIYLLALWGFGLYHVKLANINQKNKEQLANVQKVQSNVISYWHAEKKLPNTINDLNVGNYVVPKDVFTDVDYEYSTSSDRNFKICATFAKDKLKDDQAQAYPNYGSGNSINDWGYEEGYYCFDRFLDPKAYPTSTTPTTNYGMAFKSSLRFN